MQYDSEHHVQHALDTGQMQPSGVSGVDAQPSLWDESLYRHIVETAMEGIWVINANSQTVLVNQMMAGLLGCSPDEMLGKSMFEFMDATGQEIALKNVERRRQGIRERHDFKFQRRDGTDLWVIISTNPLFDASGHYIGALGMVTDITERKQWEDFLQEANEQLGIQVTTQNTKLQDALHRLQQEMKKRKQVEHELRVALAREKELNQLKSRFVSMVSHEFGNPLAVILTSSELIENIQLRADEKAKYFCMIREAIAHMSQLMQDVLLIGEGETEPFQVMPTLLDLTQFCDHILTELRLNLGQNHQLHMVNHCDDLIVWIDVKLLRQILSNLLTNAIKYSPHGGTIQLELIRQDTQFVIQVKDEGIGIPQQDIPCLFDSFMRAGNVGKIPGTGLGLAVVKHCVHLLQGQINVSSEVGKGTTFQVSLPLP